MQHCNNIGNAEAMTPSLALAPAQVPAADASCAHRNARRATAPAQHLLPRQSAPLVQRVRQDQLQREPLRTQSDHEHTWRYLDPQDR